MRAAFSRLEAIAKTFRSTCMHLGSQFVVQDVAGEVRIQRIVWCGAAEPVLAAFGRDRRLLAAAADLLGSREMNHLINQAHFKLPGDGVEFPWHQDSTHRRYGSPEWRDVNGRGSYVQTVVALDDVTEENGPLRFIEGSARLGHLDLPPDGTLPPSVLEAGPVVSGTMRTGDVLLFGPYTVHSSLPNRSDRPRRAFLNGFAYPGANTRVYPGEGSGILVRA
jgi:ectoine hydroxylase-related dioxygenase (phytanoyl-CoA dioxygenase family)